MRFSIIRGSSVTLECTVLEDTGVAADLTGADVRAMFKKNRKQADADALFTINATITDALNGLCEVSISASQTNQTFQIMYFEVVAKLSDGRYIREVGNMEITDNVHKTLY